MKTIKIFYSRFSSPIHPDLFQNYLSRLPPEHIERNRRFRRWQDQHNHLFGKILLLNQLKEFGPDVFSRIEYNAHDRPYFADGGLDFNISHSEDLVASAVSEGMRIGLDVEKIIPINFADFSNIHSENQWQDIHESKNAQKAFFDYWTAKESVIKADGRGLSLPLNEIDIAGNKAHYGKSNWHLKPLQIVKDYASCIAASEANFQVEINEIDFSNPLDVQKIISD